MAEDPEELIGVLALWRTEMGEESLRDRAIVKLREFGPQVVPLLIERLDGLLAASARHRERVAAVQEVWTAWYEESDRLSDEHGVFADVERYRTIPTETLPRHSAEDDNYRDPYDLKQGIIEALHQFGDQRAAAVIAAALADSACVHVAAEALRDIRFDQAVPALLDAAARTKSDDLAFRSVLATLHDYGVSMTQARERFEAETSPQGRVSLMRLLTKLPGNDGGGRPVEAEIRDSLIFLAMDDRDTSVRWDAIRALDKIEDPTAEWEFRLSDWDAPPSADIIRSAIALAAHGNPPSSDRELTRRIRQIAHTPSATRAVEAVLTQDSPQPDAQELRLALRLVLRVNTDNVEDPMGLVRALYQLSSHSQVGDRALIALRRGDLLFRQMIQNDRALREEARTFFEAIATSDDHARFARWTAVQSGRWSRLLRRFRRRPTSGGLAVHAPSAEPPISSEHGSMDLKSHRGQVEALVRRAGDLERRASDAAAEHIQQLETQRTLYHDNVEALEALRAFVETGKKQLLAIRDLHQLIVEEAGAAPPTTKLERQRSRRDLADGVAAMERGVVQMEKGLV